MQFAKTLDEGLPPAKFAALLTSMDVTQVEFAQLTGLAISSINRYCAPTRKDGRNPPRYILALALCYGMLSRTRRDEVREAMV